MGDSFDETDQRPPRAEKAKTTTKTVSKGIASLVPGGGLGVELFDGWEESKTSTTGRTPQPPRGIGVAHSVNNGGDRTILIFRPGHLSAGRSGSTTAAGWADDVTAQAPSAVTTRLQVRTPVDTRADKDLDITANSSRHG